MLIKIQKQSEREREREKHLAEIKEGSFEIEKYLRFVGIRRKIVELFLSVFSTSSKTIRSEREREREREREVVKL